ncbi:ABC transporter substrate-binding protein [Olleya sp. HaHaR_3_96]|uniref:ABC transporter substrate-binding protein n=1 Tax=Olleya sp. HaHaR_3_96 TaxID=2745560 RepID=UPI001C4F8BB2|nr:helical backbone metal receptor [Olleya sp. HaHaR_3_96]QXP59755.1 ABC transporter substrate-binding protein [Olleya sp. HaHaR_3_96]
MKIKDQIGNLLEFDSTPIRIVSLVPSQTELLYDLGLEDAIVGLTKFCVHPIHLKKKKQVVGGTKQINIEKIKALQPDIILCNKEENTEAIVIACQIICPVHVSDIMTIEESIDLIMQYGQIFNVTNKAQDIKDEINNNLKDFRQYITDQPVLKVAYFIWKDPWMVAANGTFINHLLELNKLENIYANQDRYPEVDITKIQKEDNLEVVLLSSEPFPFKIEHTLMFGEITNQAKAILVDGEYFSWYGSRLINAFSYFKDLRERLRTFSS